MKSGKCESEDCLEAWESIIKKQYEQTGNQQYNALFRLNKGYLIHLNNYNLIRACLILVGLNHLYLDWEYIKILQDNGHNIDITSPESVIESVNAGLHKCENLITKAVTKKKEIELIMKQHQSDKKEEGGINQIIASLHYEGFLNVNEDLTLSMYNEYQKLLKVKYNGRNK